MALVTLVCRDTFLNKTATLSALRVRINKNKTAAISLICGLISEAIGETKIKIKSKDYISSSQFVNLEPCLPVYSISLSLSLSFCLLSVLPPRNVCMYSLSLAGSLFLSLQSSILPNGSAALSLTAAAAFACAFEQQQHSFHFLLLLLQLLLLQ